MEKVKFLIKIQSFTDIITNSSSETFLIENKTGKTDAELIEFLYKLHEEKRFHGPWETYDKMTEEEKHQYDIGSGMGGEFEIYTSESAKEHDYAYLYFRGLKEPEKYLVIDTDWANYYIIDWIKDNLTYTVID